MRQNNIVIGIFAICLATALVSCSWFGWGQKEYGRFRITKDKYSEDDDLEQIVKSEFGDDYRLADWDDILPLSDGIEAWADGIGMPEGEDNSLMISKGGNRFLRGNRQYYMSRFNHKKPRHYLAHDNIHDSFICLGSWVGLDMHVLAIRKSL